MKFIGEKKQSQRNPNRILTMLEKQVTEMHQDHKPYNPPSTQHYIRSLPPQKVLLTKHSYPSRQETNPTPKKKKTNPWPSATLICLAFQLREIRHCSLERFDIFDSNQGKPPMHTRTISQCHGSKKRQCCQKYWRLDLVSLATLQ